MATDLVILGLATCVGFYMAWNIGANDVANSMATAVGAKAITLKQAVIIAGVLNVAGAVLVGKHVTGTVSKGVVDPSAVGDVHTLMLGMLATLLASGIWVTLATWKSMPVSTTHSIIGALVGFGLVSSGPGAIDWNLLTQVVASWVISPVMGGLISFVLFHIIIKTIFNAKDPLRAAYFMSPFLIGSTFFIISAALLLKTEAGEYFVGGDIDQALIASAMVAAIAGLTGFAIMRKVFKRVKGYTGVEMFFRRLQILTSCYVAFSHGANDVANAIGPLATIFEVNGRETIPSEVSVPMYLLFLGGIGIMVGIMTWGYRVIKTVAFKITDLTNTRGFSVDFGVATTVLMASKMGLPVSTTHTAIGAVVGVGLAGGLAGVDLRVLRKIVVSWVITLPVAAGASAGIFLGLCAIL